MKTLTFLKHQLKTETVCLMSKLPGQLSSHPGLCERSPALARDQAGNQAGQPRRPHSPCSFGRSSKKCHIFAETF